MGSTVFFTPYKETDINLTFAFLGSWKNLIFLLFLATEWRKLTLEKPPAQQDLTLIAWLDQWLWWWLYRQSTVWSQVIPARISLLCIGESGKEVKNDRAYPTAELIVSASAVLQLVDVYPPQLRLGLLLCWPSDQLTPEDFNELKLLSHTCCAGLIIQQRPPVRWRVNIALLCSYNFIVFFGKVRAAMLSLAGLHLGMRNIGTDVI